MGGVNQWYICWTCVCTHTHTHTHTHTNKHTLVCTCMCVFVHATCRTFTEKTEEHHKKHSGNGSVNQDLNFVLYEHKLGAVVLSQSVQFENRDCLHWPLYDYWLTCLYRYNTEPFLFSEIFVFKACSIKQHVCTFQISIRCCSDHISWNY